MSGNMQPPRGTYDALPEKARRMRFIENTARDVFENYGFGEIRTPMFEFTDVFARNVGDSTDIVNKEMYTFADRNGESITLRPENTAAVVRAFLSNGMKQHLPLKLWYTGPMFRYERPQKGRYRQFYQVGIEVFGLAGPQADVEVIAAGVAFVSRVLGGDKSKFKVVLNSLGTKEDRKVYREKLLEYFAPVKDQLSKESQTRLDVNPLRVLDSKEQQDKKFVADAPKPIDMLCDESKNHFESVKSGLDALGIKYEIDPSIVRGLDYYTHTVFEVHGEGLGSQSQVVGGGRYDGLMEQMGGDAIPGVGFGIGLERLEMMMPELPDVKRPVSFVVTEETALPQVWKVSEELRAANIPAFLPLETPLTGFKSQFKKANKANAAYTVVIGSDELEKGVAQVKNMDEGEQQEVSFDKLADYLKGEMK